MESEGKAKIALIAYILVTISILFLVGSSYVESSGYLYSVQIGRVLGSIGSTLFSISLISLIYDYAMKAKFTQAVKEKLGESLEEKFRNINHLKESGIDNAYKDFPAEIVRKRFSEATEEIFILQTWIPETAQLIEPIGRALRNGAKVRVLLLAPGCDQSLARSRDLECDHEMRVASKTDNSIDDLYRAFKVEVTSNKLYIGLYKGTPTTAIYGADQNIYAGMYLRNTDSAIAPHLEIIGSKSFYYQVLKDHFESVFRESTSYDPHNKSMQPTAYASAD